MDPTQVVQEQVDAFNARDVARFVSFYSPDAVVVDGQGNVMAQGHGALQTLYGQLFAQSPDLHCEIPRRIQVGTHVIAEEVITGFNFAGMPPEVHAAVVYRVEGDRIQHVQVLY
jgi:hypothetical protein